MNIVFLTSFAQVNERLKDSVEIDSVPAFADPKYREDQFYTTITYNIMQGKPAGYSQYSFSTGLSAGFLRDMPINKRRNHSIALGLGYSYSNIKHNLIVEKGSAGNIYHVDAEGSFDKNKLVLHYLEVPLELRWRNSDSISHQFWRIYAGFKLSYMIYDKAQYESGEGGTIKVRKDDNMNRIIYGAYISAGWNTWNFYAYYGLTPIYKDARLESGDKLKLQSFNLGLIFYIL
ncbi:porin family protein [Flavobacterium sp. DGU11]|uniref:Porin family protein n=1 Tax=Flavobacterium arundinis TaxID=3139143 RepID=A0ABU9I1B4_9FLAO